MIKIYTVIWFSSVVLLQVMAFAKSTGVRPLAVANDLKSELARYTLRAYENRDKMFYSRCYSPRSPMEECRYPLSSTFLATVKLGMLLGSLGNVPFAYRECLTPSTLNGYYRCISRPERRIRRGIK